MAKLVNQIFCETHQCPISITGCMLRQQRNQDNPPVWMYNKIPGDPKCSDCTQGKAVMKKYKHLKTKLMGADDDQYENNKFAAANRKEKFMATDTTSLDNGPAGIPADQEAGLEPKEIGSTEKANTFVATKTCSDVDCDFMCYMNEADHYFYRSKNTKDGFEGVCKKCKNKKARERRHAKKTNQQGKLVSSKKPKPKKNPEKKAAASPEKKVAEVVTPDMREKSTAEYKGRHDPDIKWIRAGVINEKKDTIQKNNHPVDLDEMVKQVFEHAGYSHLYEELERAAFIDMRSPHLEALFLMSCQLEERGLV